MRELYLLLLVMFVVCACEKAENNIHETQSDMGTPDVITEEEALDIVINQMILFDENKTKSFDYEVLSVDVINPPTKSELKAPLYLFNFKNNNGFALISADKRDSNTIYTISTEGNIQSEWFHMEASPYSFLLECIYNGIGLRVAC